jgi:hypothetical protein
MESINPPPASSTLEPRSITCQLNNSNDAMPLRIATFFVLSILCHAATLHSAPGQYRKVILARAIGMIFSPVTAGLFSLMALGRMGTAWLSIVARAIELVARVLPPDDQARGEAHAKDGTAVELNNLNTNGKEKEDSPDSEPPASPVTPRIEVSHSELRPAAGGERHLTDPLPIEPVSGHRPSLVPRRTDISPHGPRSPEVQRLQKSPIQSTLNLAFTLAKDRERIRKGSRDVAVDVEAELPHRMHTRAIIAGAVAIHVPHCFRELLRTRNWDRLDKDTREITTEYSRVPEADPAFDELLQYILPPTAVLLDKTFRVFPESVFREAAAGLLQLGFGLYQLVSDDARYSVARDGLASPFLIVLPYLGMATVNTIINVLDPPYPVVTVIDISPAARYEFVDQTRSDRYRSSTQSTNGDIRKQSEANPRSITLSLPNRPNRGESSTHSGIEMAPSASTTFRLDTSMHGSKFSPPLVQSPGSGSFSGIPSFVHRDGQQLKWNHFIEWIDFAYGKRVDVSPVDRLYQSAWISHSIIIGEFIYTTIVGFFIPGVMLAVVGGWTRFETSNYGLSLAFNLVALFGVPLIQFFLYTHYRFMRMLREFQGRKTHGTFYYPDPELGGPTRRTRKDQKRLSKSRTMPVGWTRRTRALWWMSVIGESVGIYFPMKPGIILGYVLLVLGVGVCEFALVGINLVRTLNCESPLV